MGPPRPPSESGRRASSPGARTPPRRSDSARTAPAGALVADAASSLVVAKPVGPGRPAAAAKRQQRGVEGHRAEPADRGRPAISRAAPLQLFNYADYIDPATVKKFEKQFDTEVKIGTYNSSDEAIAKLSSGQVDYDVVLGLERERDRPDDGEAARAAAQPQLPAEPREHLAPARRSVLRQGIALHRPVRRVAGRDRLAKRQGERGHREHGRPVGHLLGVPGLQGQGRAPRRQAGRAQHADAAERHAQRHARRREHRGPRRSSAAPARTSSSSRPSRTSRSRSPTTRRCRRARSWLHHSWSGDLHRAPRSVLPPPGHTARGALLLAARHRRCRPERLLLHRARLARSPFSPTRSSTSCSTRRTPTTT